MSYMRKIRLRKMIYIWVSAFRLRCSFCSMSHFWHMICFQFYSLYSFHGSFVDCHLIIEVIARSMILLLCTDEYMYISYPRVYDSRHKSLPWERKENRRIDITRKWRTASLRWNHSWKPTAFARKTVEIATARLLIVLKGNRNFATNCPKTHLTFFNLFSLVCHFYFLI